MPKGKTRRCNECKAWRAITQFPFTGENKKGKRYRRRICNVCRVEERRISKEKWYKRAYTAKTFKLAYDPSSTYFVGARFFKGVVMETLKDGNWPPGMWWLDEETGIKYEVQGNEEMHLFVGIRDIKSESQRLVRSYGDRQPPGGR